MTPEYSNADNPKVKGYEPNNDDLVEVKSGVRLFVIFPRLDGTLYLQIDPEMDMQREPALAKDCKLIRKANGERIDAPTYKAGKGSMVSFQSAGHAPAETIEQWIPVSERLPEYRCLSYSPNTTPENAYRVVPKGLMKISTDATHWKPLAPPQDATQ